MFPRRLRLEVMLLLGLKALMLAAIYYAFIAHAERPEPNAQAMRSHFVDQLLP